MAKTQKAKTNKGVRNDERKNGKARKTNPGRKSTHTPPTELEKVLLGKGLYTKWNRVLKGNSKGLPERKHTPLPNTQSQFEVLKQRGDRW